MQNVGAPQFDFGTFKAAYDTDPRVKAMIKNFDKLGIEPKTKKPASGANKADTDQADTTVSQMAKSATDVGAKL